MIDQEESSVPALAPQEDGELLLYDYFKHLTTLSLLTLGGVLTVAQVADRTDVKPWLLVVVLLTISLAGVLSYSGAGEIVRARYTQTARYKSLELYRRVAPILLAVGVGMFLSMFVDTMD